MKLAALVLLVLSLLAMGLSSLLVGRVPDNYDRLLHYVEGVENAGFDRSKFDAIAYTIRVDRKDARINLGLSRQLDLLSQSFVAAAGVLLVFARTRKLSNRLPETAP